MMLLWIAALIAASVVNGVAALVEQSGVLAWCFLIFHFTFTVIAALEWQAYWREEAKEEA